MIPLDSKHNIKEEVFYYQQPWMNDENIMTNETGRFATPTENLMLRESRASLKWIWIPGLERRASDIYKPEVPNGPTLLTHGEAIENQLDSQKSVDKLF